MCVLGALGANLGEGELQLNKESEVTGNELTRPVRSNGALLPEALFGCSIVALNNRELQP